MKPTPLQPAPARYCRSCGYVLDHLDQRRCPECGRGFDPGDSTTYVTRYRPRLRMLMLVLRRAVICLFICVLLLLAAVSIYHLWFAWGTWRYQRSRYELIMRGANTVGDGPRNKVGPELDVRIGGSSYQLLPLALPSQVTHASWPMAGDGEMRILADDPSMVTLDLIHSRVTDAGLANLVGQRQLIRLRLAQTVVTGRGFSHLHGLPLRWLSLAGTPVEDEALGRLAPLKALEVLNLRNTAITDAGLAALTRGGALQKLGVLDLQGTKVTDLGLAALVNLPALHTLNLSDTAITDAGLPQLSSLGLLHLRVAGTAVRGNGVFPLKSLEVLDLGSCPVTDLQVRQLPRRLGHLILSDTAITDGAAPALANLPLRELDLAGTAVTEASLLLLGNCATLQHLSLRRTRIKKVAPLRALPPGATGVWTLDLSDTSGSGDDLGRVVPTLSGLNLSRMQLSSQAVAGFAGANLSELNLCGTNLSDEMCVSLAGVSWAMNLSDTDISDVGLQAITSKDSRLVHPSGSCGWIFARTAVTGKGFRRTLGNPNHRFLEISLAGCPLTRDGFQALLGAVGDPRFLTLDLSQTPIQDDWLALLPVRRKGRLFLRLNDTAISDAGLEHVRRQRGLGLEVCGAKVTDRGAAAFLRAQPTASIYWREPRPHWNSYEDAPWQ